MFKTIAFVILLIGVCRAHPTRIVAGKDTNITETPWQVSLQYRSSGIHFCGGSIISDRWILTAGHCVPTDPSPTNKQVVVGVTKLSEGGVVHTVKQAIRSPLYGSMHAFSHDISLLELNEPIKFNEGAKAVRLPKDDEPLPKRDTVCTIQGWGLLSQHGKSPDHLQSTTLPLWDPKDCAKTYKYAEELFVGPKAPLVCAGWKGSYTDTCNGDSGGPLTYEGVQYGIVSFGMGCANPNFPKIFSHVYNMRDFIHAHTGL